MSGNTDLADFLRARYAERRAIAEAAAALQYDPENGWGILDHSGDAQSEKRRWISPHIGVLNEVESANHVIANNPAVVIADIDSKLAVVDAYVGAEKALEAWTCPDDRIIGHAHGLDDALRLLALPFAGHPEYKEEWRP